ncbi:DNA-binding response regulator [Mycetocola tolaasinivorans]|uniref:DNA-binding response regulator n=1 Tax=Mycetocola tolaasinivorans TaxID=76635 RepID=A0A3L7AB19_9MICO|nr:response regulator transcription factor [Mycetocola tolaasinivorans]RLP76861.1 DNA-binding response regulator [Mycetocola tolaasinivorans]
MSEQDTRIARVALVEDHLLQRTRTEEILSRTGEYRVVFSGPTAPDFVRWVESVPREERPHLLVLDLMVDRQPSVSPAQVEKMVRAGLTVLVLSALASPVLVRQVLRAGVAGIVGKRDSEDDILAAVRAVLAGEQWMTTELATVIAGDPERPALSVQEERALVLYASGLSIEEVGTAMNIGRETAKQYLDRVKKKYAGAGVSVRTQLDFGRVAWAEGYLDPSLPQAP